MLKELKYFIYLFSIIVFISYISFYYFSDDNKKKSYRSIDLINEKITSYTDNIIVLEDNTTNVIEYINDTGDNDKRNYKFWDLLKND